MAVVHSMFLLVSLNCHVLRTVAVCYPCCHGDRLIPPKCSTRTLLDVHTYIHCPFPSGLINEVSIVRFIVFSNLAACYPQPPMCGAVYL